MNWNFADGATSTEQPVSELKKAYTYTGRVVPNRLPESRIQDMKGTHFEIGSKAETGSNTTLNKETYAYPRRSSVGPTSPNIAWD